MNPISIAIKGKGPLNSLRRVASIARRYGATPGKMERALAQFILILDRFGCRATFPIPLVALQRNPRLIGKYHAQGIEFAVHGYRHLDHSQLSRADQLAHLTLTRQVMVRSGIRAQGFRGPYLRRNPDTLAALEQQGFAYDNSQALAWDVLEGADTSAYRHVLNFYKAQSANDYPSLPSLEENLVCMPYSLPDDEALIERLSLKTSAQMSALWLAILRRTYELGELFTLGLHPERITVCQEPLAAVLGEACQLTPSVWIARLDEIAAWWRARAAATFEITDTGDGRFRIAIKGPSGLTVLVRAVQVQVPTQPWIDGYQWVDALSFTVQTDRHPLIGIAPRSSVKLLGFLRQQGYLVETAADACRYSIYIDQADFAAQDERALLARLRDQGSLSAAGPLARWSPQRPVHHWRYRGPDSMGLWLASDWEMKWTSHAKSFSGSRGFWLQSDDQKTLAPLYHLVYCTAMGKWYGPVVTGGNSSALHTSQSLRR